MGLPTYDPEFEARQRLMQMIAMAEGNRGPNIFPPSGPPGAAYDDMPMEAEEEEFAPSASSLTPDEFQMQAQYMTPEEMSEFGPQKRELGMVIPPQMASNGFTPEEIMEAAAAGSGSELQALHIPLKPSPMQNKGMMPAMDDMEQILARPPKFRQR